MTRVEEVARVIEAAFLKSYEERRAGHTTPLAAYDAAKAVLALPQPVVAEPDGWMAVAYDPVENRIVESCRCFDREDAEREAAKMRHGRVLAGVAALFAKDPT